MLAETILLVTEQQNERLDRIMTALDNLQAADSALKAEVATFLSDMASRLASSNDAAVQSVADDINAQVASLQSGDPSATVTGTAPAPADPTTGVPATDPATGVPPVTP